MLIGDSSLEITQGETFDDPGVSVSGGQGDTSAIEITGEIGSFPVLVHPYLHRNGCFR